MSIFEEYRALKPWDKKERNRIYKKNNISSRALNMFFFLGDKITYI